MPEQPDSSVHRWAVAAVALTFMLIVAGGLVTSRDAGLAVPDWPLSFGQLNPPRWYAIQNVRTEHGHRVIAGCVALFTVLLAFKIRRSDASSAVRRLGTAAAGLVLLQALLGGLRVLHLSVDLAMVHGWLAQMFFGLLVAIATLTSPHWLGATKRVPAPDAEPVWRLSLAVVTLIVVQLVVGIAIRHLGASARPLLGNGVFYVHVATAALIAWLAVQTRSRVLTGGDRHLARLATRLVTLVGVQIFLGVAAFLVTETMTYDRQATFFEAWLPTLHVAAGAALLATGIATALHAHGRRSPAQATPQAHAAEVA